MDSNVIGDGVKVPQVDEWEESAAKEVEKKSVEQKEEEEEEELEEKEKLEEESKSNQSISKNQCAEYNLGLNENKKSSSYLLNVNSNPQDKTKFKTEFEDNKNNKKMAYDDVILHMGQFGRYQRRIYLLLCLPAISCAFHKMSGVFLGAKPDFRCLLPNENPDNVTFRLPDDIRNMSFPWDNSTNSISQCKRYDVNFTDSYYASKTNYSNSTSTLNCDSFVYDTSTYKLTTTTQWNLVCDKTWLRAIGDSLFMVGVMLGSMVFGALSDRYGRKPIFFFSLVIQLVFGILVAVSPEYVSYVIFRLILGSTTSGVFLVAYVIALEMVGPQKRTVAGVGCQLFFTTGYILTTAFAYYITDWRYLQIAITIPGLAFLLYWWFIPESARWLLTKGRVEEAKEILKKASLENGVELPQETVDHLLLSETENNTPDSKQASILDLFKYPNLRRKSILLFFNWFVNSGTYYGLSWNSANLGGNDYLNFVIGGFVEIPAYTFLLFTLNIWGRKVILCGCMLLAGVSLLLTLFVPTHMSWLTITLAMLGKMAITSSYGAVYVFTAEQFPTVIRNVGLGACSTFARIGGVIAPYINNLAEIWLPFPLVVFGSLSLVGGVMSLLLPETLDKKLPETIEDGEQFGKNIRKGERDAKQLNDIEIMKPLKSLENGVYEKQNG